MKKTFCLFSVLSLAFVSYCCGADPSERKTWNLPPHVSPGDYEENIVVVKLKPAFQKSFAESRNTAELNDALAKINAQKPERLFPRHSAPLQHRAPSGQALVDLSLIYKIRFSSGADISKVVNSLLGTGVFEYIEPMYINKPLYVPNDSLVLTQWNHQLIQSFAAWDIQKGNSGIVIGITDTGIDTLHPELVNQIKYNNADPINGIDDDLDGYIDNYYGWNVATNSYDVSRNELHGSFVAGIAAAETDNTTGIAGVGFDCSFLPVACSNSPSANVIINGDLAIQYAADHGAQVINCSWGGFGNSQFSQDMVNYATFNQNALVVAAAGNSQNDIPFYPASYENVLSVAAIDSFDVKWTGSSFGSYVDITSQGDRVRSVWPGGGYGFSGGTSEACPQVSGAAALVKAQFPTLTALQIGERLRATADNTDALPGNALYIRKLGKGRLNIFRALTEPAKSIRAVNMNVTDGNDNFYEGNDTLSISAVFVNYLDSLVNCSVTFSCNSPFVTVLNPLLTLGGLGTLAADSNRTNPFRALIDPAVPYNARLVFTFEFQDGSYSDWQSFELTVNVDYLNVKENDIGVTVTSKGRLGFNDAGNTQGIGFTHNDGPNFLYGGSFVVGVNDTTVSDATFATGGLQNNHFRPLEFMHKIIPPVVSDFDASARFNDSANSNPLGIEVQHNVYAWGNIPDRKYVICEYTIKNSGTGALSPLHAGLYCDWDINATTYLNNRCDYDALNRMGYQYYVSSNNQYVGIKLLTGGTPNYYAFDNDGSLGSINIYDGFTQAEKFQSMSAVSRLSAGPAVTGNDASMMLATGPFTIAAGDSIRIAFALLGGDSLAELESGAMAAQLKYDSVLSGIHENNLHLAGCSIYPNPVSKEFTIRLYSPVNSKAVVRIFDITGREIKHFEETLTGGINTLKHFSNKPVRGTYICETVIGEEKFVNKIIVQ